MVNLVGGLYPALYDWLAEAPVIPEFPFGTCVTSGIEVRCEVTAGIECEPTATSDCVRVTFSPVPVPVTPVEMMACEFVVRQAVECETLECHSRVTSECVKVSREEPDVEEQSTVCAEVSVRYAGVSAIDCTMLKVTAEVTVRTLVTADMVLKCCCVETRS